MDNYKFVVGHDGRDLEGVVPGDILPDAIALAVQKLRPDVLPRRQEWLRSEITEFMSKDAVTPRYPLVWLHEDDPARVRTTVTVHRISGTVPPLEPPPELTRPVRNRPAEWEGLVHRQMYRYLRGQIEAGVYAVGDELPDPEQLQWHFGSDSKGRRAYAHLLADGLITGHGDGPYVVVATTPPPVQTVAAAVDRLDALEESLQDTLVALRALRGDLAGVQTPRCGQWWLVRSLAHGADPAIELSNAVCVRDSTSGELQWLACISNTWVRKPLSYFAPLRRLAYISDWSDADDGASEPVAPSDERSARPVRDAGGAVAVAGVAYYSTDDQQDANADRELYGPELWPDA